jgi:hypothetical protein
MVIEFLPINSGKLGGKSGDKVETLKKLKIEGDYDIFPTSTTTHLGFYNQLTKRLLSFLITIITTSSCQ